MNLTRLSNGLLCSILEANSRYSGKGQIRHDHPRAESDFKLPTSAFKPLDCDMAISRSSALLFFNVPVFRNLNDEPVNLQNGRLSF
jgi:hypothetical protein